MLEKLVLPKGKFQADILQEPETAPKSSFCFTIVLCLFFCTTSYQTFKLIVYIWVVQYGRTHDSVDRYGISVSQKVTDALFVVITILSFPRSFSLIKVRRRVQIVEHELISFLEHMCSPVHQCISSPGKNK